jgi:hypothetical protein
MKVESLYVIAVGTQGETTEVTVGLYHKHAPTATNAVGILLKMDDNDDSALGTLYKIPNLLKGNPSGLSTTQSSVNKTRNFKPPVARAPQTNFSPDEVPEQRASAGIYFVCHGQTYMDMGNEGGWMVNSIAVAACPLVSVRPFFGLRRHYALCGPSRLRCWYRLTSAKAAHSHW